MLAFQERCRETNLAGIPVFGPSLEAAQLEGSKAFSKQFMVRNGIPTAAYSSFTDYSVAKTYILQVTDVSKIVIKASGLAAGKGVILPVTMQEALEALESIMCNKAFGCAGDEVVIEEKLEGEEVSVLCFSDGYTIVPMPAAQDHKRALNGDLGLNTGGMGAYCPAPIYTREMEEIVMRTVLKPTIDGMRRMGIPFVGILYAGLMLTETGPKVLEYNVRFGDPETQVVLPLLHQDTELVDVLLACCNGCLDSVQIKFKKAFAATIVGASPGYPGTYRKGDFITIPEFPVGTTCFHAGTTTDSNGKLVSCGGRVLSVTSVASTLKEALESANFGIARIGYTGMHYRTDIGHRALSLTKKVNSGTTYADAGVNIDAGNLLVEKIKPFVKATMRSGADAELGGFGGLFDLKAAGYKDPILVSGTDGVGTKLKIAQECRKHDTIGIDLVAMSVNDVLVQGAEPLFFLDYFATSKLEIQTTADVVIGIAKGCKDSNCALVGGETAEMPGIYANGDYDLAGFVVGCVERDQVLPRLDDIKAGDVLLGLASSGVHSNGFSLVRHVLKQSGLTYNSPSPFSSHSSLGEALLEPTRIYVKALLPVIRAQLVKSMVHITGGGFLDNVPRSLPRDKCAEIECKSWPLPPVFKWLKQEGSISNLELCRTFNCGIGMVLVVSPSHVDQILEMLDEPVYRIGHVGELRDECVVMRDMDTCWN